MLTKKVKRIIKYFVTHNKTNTTLESWKRFFLNYELPEILKAKSILDNYYYD